MGRGVSFKERPSSSFVILNKKHKHFLICCSVFCSIGRLYADSPLPNERQLQLNYLEIISCMAILCCQHGVFLHGVWSGVYWVYLVSHNKVLLHPNLPIEGSFNFAVFITVQKKGKLRVLEARRPATELVLLFGSVEN